MNFYTCYMRQSTCWKAQENCHFAMHGIVVHSTGCNNPRISRYVQPDDNSQEYTAMIELLGKNKYKNDWNHKDVEKGVHAFIGLCGDNKTVATVRVLRDDMEAWGVGKHEITGKSYNFDPPYMQFEICEDDLENEEYFEKVMREAIEYCAYLCEIHGWDPNQRIVSHKEAHDQGYGCDHGDPDYWLKKYGKSMNWFRQEVSILMKADALIENPDMPGEVHETPIETEKPKQGIFSRIDWKNVGERALWTFIEGFVVALPSTIALDVDGALWKSILGAAVMSGISAVKNMIAEIGGIIHADE